MEQKKVRIIYYSFTNQTSRLVTRFTEGLESCGIDVQVEKLRPANRIPFPFPSTIVLLKYMVSSFFRCRTSLQPLSLDRDENLDLIILAGPTWSYNPSGPILWFLDNCGKKIIEGHQVLPVISCRAYWRTHYYCLKGKLKKCGATVRQPVVFRHPTNEPWKTTGLVMQLLGRLPVSGKFRERYPHYGHGQSQFYDAEEEGRRIGRELIGN